MTMQTDTYTYNDDLTIRSTDDGNEIVVVYVDEVEYINAVGAWSSQGFRWAIVEPHLTEEEVKNWLLNNGLSTVPFIRG